jgi:CheY-like chemotaxis protein
MSTLIKPLVLVVDDVQKNIDLMRAVLAPAGYQVSAATDGPTALALALAQKPQLILLDVMMPGMDGYAVCSRLKEMEATRHIPVIFVTARDDVAAEARCFALGAADYIMKPIRVPVVLARVSTHLALYDQRRSLEGMFRDVMEFAPDAFILSDEQGRIVRINARAEALFGYHRDELIGLPVQVLMPSGPGSRRLHATAPAGR